MILQAKIKNEIFDIIFVTGVVLRRFTIGERVGMSIMFVRGAKSDAGTISNAGEV